MAHGKHFRHATKVLDLIRGRIQEGYALDFQVRHSFLFTARPTTTHTIPPGPRRAFHTGLSHRVSLRQGRMLPRRRAPLPVHQRRRTRPVRSRTPSEQVRELIPPGAGAHRQAVAVRQRVAALGVLEGQGG